MPGLLRAIINVMMIIFVLGVLGLFVSLIRPGDSSLVGIVTLIVSLHIQFFIIWGLNRRSPRAWTWPRILSIAGILLTLLNIILLAFLSPLHALIGLAVYAIPLGVNVFVFVGLVKTAVRRWFCPPRDEEWGG